MACQQYGGGYHLGGAAIEPFPTLPYPSNVMAVGA